MGQYYRQAINYNGEVYYSDRRVEGCGYEMAKLMEHSYFGNHLMDSVAKILNVYDDVKLAWIGDYATPSEVGKKSHGEVKYRDCWGGKNKRTGEEYDGKCNEVFDKSDFKYGHKYLVNKDKKVYISFDHYRAKCRKLWVEKGWELNPISILTAIGNGRGGGDYCGIHMKHVGSWAWDRITIEDKKPVDMTELKIAFVEGDEKEEE